MVFNVHFYGNTMVHLHGAVRYKNTMVITISSKNKVPWYNTIGYHGIFQSTMILVLLCSYTTEYHGFSTNFYGKTMVLGFSNTAFIKYIKYHGISNNVR